MNAAQHIEKARKVLASGRFLLTGDFIEEAGRAAYLAGFHAAHAYIRLKDPDNHVKTHDGLKGRFGLLSLDDARIEPGFRNFLGRAYGLKQRSDYEAVTEVQAVDVVKALDEAERLVNVVAALIPN